MLEANTFTIKAWCDVSLYIVMNDTNVSQLSLVQLFICPNVQFLFVEIAVSSLGFIDGNNG